MKVKDVLVTQKKNFNILKQAYDNDRLSHAYLFYGEKGTGKKEMAYALACMLYCKNGCCFECPECKRILSGNHINVSYITVDDDKKQISKEQIIQLQDEFSKTSLEEGPRVYIVDGIDETSISGQNSLLKFIEEPQNKEKTIGIFIATELSNVVTTIQSRCVLEHFDNIPRDSLRDIIHESGIELIDASLLSCLTNDSDDALEIYKNDNYFMVRDSFLELLDIKTKKDMTLFYLKNQMFYSDYQNLNMLLSFILQFLEDVNLSKNSTDKLILKPLCDKILSYKKKNNNLEEKYENILNDFKMLKANVLAKNVFFDIVDKFI